VTHVAAVLVRIVTTRTVSLRCARKEDHLGIECGRLGPITRQAGQQSPGGGQMGNGRVTVMDCWP
jgi:hypothetical protein